MRKLFVIFCILFCYLNAFSEYKIYFLNDYHETIDLNSNLNWYLVFTGTTPDNWPFEKRIVIDVDTNIQIRKDTFGGQYQYHLDISSELRKEIFSFKYGANIRLSYLISTNDTMISTHGVPFRRFSIEGKLSIGEEKNLRSVHNESLSIISSGIANIKGHKLIQEKYQIHVLYSDSDSVFFLQELNSFLNFHNGEKGLVSIKRTSYINDDDIEDFVLEYNNRYYLFLSNKGEIQNNQLFHLENSWYSFSANY